MKTIRTGLAIAALAAMQGTHAQDWARLPGGNVITTNEWMGADVGSLIPLSFETRVNQPMQWRTNSALRMMLHETLLAQTIGTYTNENLTGNLGVGAFTSANVPRPFSLLHLDNGGTQFSGYRPWQRPGMTVTNGSDMGWIGLKNEGGDLNHFTIAWADNTTIQGPDLFKVIFLAPPGTAGTAGTLDGLETMRIVPAGTGLQSFVGLGDWFTAVLNPTERLDLLNGRARIRQLPTDPVSASTEIVTVNTTPGANFGVLEHRPFGSFGLGTCDWSMNALSPNHVWTAFGAPDPNCPDDAENVGIGNNAPVAKLDIARSVNGSPVLSTGFNLRMSTTSANNTGGNCDVQVNAPGVNTGWRANVRLGGQNWGIDGNAAQNNLVNSVLWNGSRLAGVRGFADGNNTMTKPNVRGVWGIAIGAINPSGGAPLMGYAGWFDGDVNIQGGNLFINQVFAISDASMKTNVEELTNGADLIAQFEPKTYLYDTLTHPELGLSSGPQCGLLAQDVEQIMPELVSEVQHAAIYDSLGVEITPEYTLKAVNYVGLIPLLIANAKEQQAVIDQLNDRLDDFEQQLAACCDQGSDSRMQEENSQAIGYIDNTRAVEDARALHMNELLVTPNPFTENPTISYRISTGGRAQLRVSNATGRAMGMLLDAGMAEGQHSMVWNTEGMASGLYLLTLTVDGQRITEQAVKVE